MFLNQTFLRSKFPHIALLAALIGTFSLGTPFENTIQKVIEVKPASNGAQLVLVEFETPLFNSEGYLTFYYNNKKVSSRMLPFSPDDTARPPRGSRRLYIVLDPSEVGSPQTVDTFKKLLPLRTTVNIRIPVSYEAVIESIALSPSKSVIIQLDSALPNGRDTGFVSITVNGQEETFHLNDYEPDGISKDSSDKFLLFLPDGVTVGDLQKLLPLTIQIKRRF